MAYLILVRHGQSEWNEKGLWTGLTDISLSTKGYDEAKKAATAITDISIDAAYTSVLSRAKQTWEEIQTTLGITPPTTENKALNERDYGEYTGKNKWDIQKQIGEDAFKKLRRSYDYPIPGGETLKDVYNRVIPYYQQEIEPQLLQNKNIIIVAHGNSLRALIKYLEQISDTDIATVELATGMIYVYTLDDNGKVVHKEIRAARANTV